MFVARLARVWWLVLGLTATGAAWAQSPGKEFRDCADCPPMVVVPPGTFMMGSPAAEAARDADEGPQRRVAIARPFAVGKYEVTRAQYAAFASETNRPALGNCWYMRLADGSPANDDAARNWRNPGYAQDDDHPAVCVTWNDAKAYAEWLSSKTGQAYRLLSEAEWEYAARAGTTTSRPWGEDRSQTCRNANIWDQSATRAIGGAGEGQRDNALRDCDDGHAYTARVGRFSANRFGLHDMIGNVWEWVEDCWNDSYAGAPSDGSAWLRGDCSARVIRGGGWETDARRARSALRNEDVAGDRNNNLGFRLARTLR